MRFLATPDCICGGTSRLRWPEQREDDLLSCRPCHECIARYDRAHAPKPVTKPYWIERHEVTVRTPRGRVVLVGISLPGEDTGCDWELRTEGSALIDSGHGADQEACMAALLRAVDRWLGVEVPA